MMRGSLRCPWLARIFPWLYRRRAEIELAEEIRLHVELETERQREKGLAPADAARAARVKLGNSALIQEDTRAVWGWSWVDDLGRDVKLTVRRLHRRPGLR